MVLFGVRGRRAALCAAMLAGLMGLGAGLAAPDIAYAQTAAAAIQVQGNKRVDADTIRGYFNLKPGDKLDAAKIDEGLKALYATGMFEDVRISQAGGRVIVTVAENPVINRVAFEGNRKVKDEQLVAEVQSKARSPLSRPMVQADVQRIIEIYRRGGRFDVRVEPKIIDRPNSRVDLVFEIKEGERTTVRKNRLHRQQGVRRLEAQGRHHHRADQLAELPQEQRRLRPRPGERRPGAAAPLLSQERLRRLPHHLGQCGERPGRLGGFVLTFTVDEGEQYRFGTIDVLSNVRAVDAATLRGKVRGSTGAVYNAELVEKSMEEITIELAKRGYAFSQVRPRGDRDFANRRINVLYTVEEGPRVYVERINVRGNTRTRDYVVRREIDLFEGDAYNRAFVDRAERRLKNLGYFKTVKITNEPGSAADRVIVNVDVEEQMTGEFSVAGGYSTSDGLIGEVSVGERNFLGRGQVVRLSASYGQLSRGAEFSFTEPYFMGYQVSAGFDLFTKVTDQSTYYSYSNRVTGGTLRSGFYLRDDLTLGLRYSLFQRDITTSSTTPPSAAILQALGQSVTSSVGYTLLYNTLDNPQNPNEGAYVNFSQDFAGVGGDVQYIRSSVDGRYYYPLTSDFTLMLRGQAGHVYGWGNTPLNIFDHFFRGPELVRGFATSGLGPRDLLAATQDALGGSLYWGATAEILFPLSFIPKDFGLRAAIFADAGSLWDYKGATIIPAIPPGASCSALSYRIEEFVRQRLRSRFQPGPHFRRRQHHLGVAVRAAALRLCLRAHQGALGPVAGLPVRRHEPLLTPVRGSMRRHGAGPVRA